MPRAAAKSFTAKLGIMHQRLTAAEREAAAHDLEPLPVLAKFLRCLERR